MDYVVGVLNSVIVLLSLFLICIILIQRGKGGGLAGAFGGAGGSSAFGTKAGDFFTRLTVGIAIGWICLAMLLVILTNNLRESSKYFDSASSLSKEFAPKAKDKTSAGEDKSGVLPPAVPTPTTGAALEPGPAVNIPAIPETPVTKPVETPAAKPSTAPTTPAPAATAPVPAPAATAPAPAPASAATPAKKP